MRRRFYAIGSAGLYAAISVSANEGFFAGLGDLGGGMRSSVAYAVSGDGRVVVGTSSVSFGVPDSQAFRWVRGSGMQSLGFLTHTAFGASYDGAVIVGHTSSGASPVFRWTQATGPVALDAAVNGSAIDVSYEGSLIAANWRPSGGSAEACRLVGNSITGLGDLGGGDVYSQALAISGDGQTVVGDSHSEQGYEAFRWTAENGMVGLGDLPGGSFESVAEAVSADGSVVVGWSLGEAFRWAATTGMVALGAGTAFGVSADGSIVVGHTPSVGAFIWDEVHGTRNLQTELEAWSPGLIPPGWTLSLATDVSADGLTIVGVGVNPSGDSEAWIVEIPCCEVMPCCHTDLDCDDRIDLNDLALFLAHFGTCAADPSYWQRADIDRQGCVDLRDLSALLSAFGKACY